MDKTIFKNEALGNRLQTNGFYFNKIFEKYNRSLSILNDQEFYYLLFNIFYIYCKDSANSYFKEISNYNILYETTKKIRGLNLYILNGLHEYMLLYLNSRKFNLSFQRNEF